MANAVTELPEVRDRHAFNLARWREICADPELARFAGRIESDAHGHVIMTPPPGFHHCSFQGRILRLLDRDGGEAFPECPVSTGAGIRAVDVAWLSDSRREEALRDNVLVVAPEICVEVISPGNTRGEMEEKRALLFAAGAEEVWFCDAKGRLSFFLRQAPGQAARRSVLCPDFPDAVA